MRVGEGGTVGRAASGTDGVGVTWAAAAAPPGSRSSARGAASDPGVRSGGTPRTAKGLGRGLSVGGADPAAGAGVASALGTVGRRGKSQARGAGLDERRRGRHRGPPQRQEAGGDQPGEADQQATGAEQRRAHEPPVARRPGEGQARLLRHRFISGGSGVVLAPGSVRWVTGWRSSDKMPGADAKVAGVTCDRPVIRPGVSLDARLYNGSDSRRSCRAAHRLAAVWHRGAGGDSPLFDVEQRLPSAWDVVLWRRGRPTRAARSHRRCY